MKKATISALIGLLEATLEDVKKVKAHFLKSDPTTNVTRYDHHIDMCERAISQFNKKLIVSTYLVEEELLEYVETMIANSKEAYLLSKA